MGSGKSQSTFFDVDHYYNRLRISAADFGVLSFGLKYGIIRIVYEQDSEEEATFLECVLH